MSMRLSGLKNKFQKLKLTPSKSDNEKRPDKQKKLNYKNKMKARYNLTDEMFEKEKAEAMTQIHNWNLLQKEMVFEMFRPTSQYVANCKKFDLLHPKTLRDNIVINKAGNKVCVEFGKYRQHLLYSVAPNPKHVYIHDIVMQSQEMTRFRKSRKVADGKQKQQIVDQWANMTSANTDAMENDNSQHTTKQTKKDNGSTYSSSSMKFVVNTTDNKRSVFSSNWYRPSISRSQQKSGKMAYWVATGDDEDFVIDDDPEGKYTVTAEKVIETLTAGGKVNDSGVVEPKSQRTALTDPLDTVYARHKKNCGRNIVYLNTLKGTIDFIKAQGSSNANSPDQADDTEEIVFAPVITAHVFEGNWLKRQYAKKKHRETYEEPRKDYTREVGEETE